LVDLALIGGYPRAQAGQLVSAAETARDQARHAAGQAEQAARLAQQEATRAQAAEQAALAETGRARILTSGVAVATWQMAAAV